MSWSDVFFPENPSRRNKVVSLCSRIFTLMEANFRATNDLIDVIHKHLPGKLFNKIKVDHDGTLRSNCDVILARINEIQTYLDEKDEALRKLLEPTLYSKLTDKDVSFMEKMTESKRNFKAGIAPVASVAGIGLVYFIRSGKILKGLVAATSVVKASAIASVTLGVFVMGIDMIASAIMGAIERDTLEDTITGLEAQFEKFEPASYQYTKSINTVEILISLQ